LSDERLAPGVEVSSFLRRAEAAGGFGTVLAKGDETRGSIMIAVAERGSHVGFFERALQSDGTYRWAEVGPAAPDSEKLAQYLGQRRRSDPDCWLIELDVPFSERFIAETIR
jgi:hypothetical protein